MIRKVAFATIVATIILAVSGIFQLKNPPLWLPLMIMALGALMFKVGTPLANQEIARWAQRRERDK